MAGGGKRQGDYTELQVGPAPSQMQTFPVPKQSTKEWTEWFKGFNGNEENLRSDNYQNALNEIDSWMRSADGMQKEYVKGLDAMFTKVAVEKPTDVLVVGQPWGALEEMLLGKPLAPGLEFKMPAEGTEEYLEVQPWVELLEKGTFSVHTLSVTPLSYQTTDRWVKVIEDSAQKYGMTWLHALHLGIAYAERGDIDKPKQLFALSIELKPNPIAMRCLAVLSSTYEEAWPYFKKAWSLTKAMSPSDPASNRMALNMITEISYLLQEQLWYDDMEEFIKDVEGGSYMNSYVVDSFLTMKLQLLLHQKQYNTAVQILSENCFPTYAKWRSDLMSFWNTAVEGIAAQKKGGGNYLTVKFLISTLILHLLFLL